jgi:hypothetical protein
MSGDVEERNCQDIGIGSKPGDSDGNRKSWRGNTVGNLIYLVTNLVFIIGSIDFDRLISENDSSSAVQYGYNAPGEYNAQITQANLGDLV